MAVGVAAAGALAVADDAAVAVADGIAVGLGVAVGPAVADGEGLTVAAADVVATAIGVASTVGASDDVAGAATFVHAARTPIASTVQMSFLTAASPLSADVTRGIERLGRPLLPRLARRGLIGQSRGQVFPPYRFLLLARARTWRGRACLHLTIAEHEHVGHLLLLRQPNLVLHPAR